MSVNPLYDPMQTTKPAPKPTLAQRVPQLRLIEELLVAAGVYRWEREKDRHIREGRCALNVFSGYASTAAEELQAQVDAGVLDSQDVSLFVRHLHLLVD